MEEVPNNRFIIDSGEKAENGINSTKQKEIYILFEGRTRHGDGNQATLKLKYGSVFRKWGPKVGPFWYFFTARIDA